MLDRTHLGFNANAQPFFAIVMAGLKGDVDGTHFWDAVAEDAVFEFIYTYPGIPRRIEGRAAYMNWFAGYRTIIHSADNLKVYHSSAPEHVIVLEYEVHGTMAGTGKQYDNRFCSIVTLRNRKIAVWHDYMDGIATLKAATPDDAPSYD